MPNDDKVNFCETGGPLSFCTAGYEWGKCKFYVRAEWLRQCRFKFALNSGVHCSSIEAQGDARG